MAIMLIIAFLLNYRSKKKKKASESDNAPKTARERDAQRVAEAKKSREKNKRKKKKAKATATSSILKPKRAIDRLPYKKILEDNIWLIGEDTYSRAYTFEDINFNMYDGNQKNATIIAYCSFLNSLDDTIDCQISLFNKPMSVTDLEREI
jgi:nicotinic acid mononucleotide adenylyltransferase